MSNVSWRQIRTLQTSQREGFEELSCQLAHTEPGVPVGSRFERKGKPDAGLECYWMLPVGEEWGWQAKYFPDGLGVTQWKQCDKSVATALESHPNLTRLYLCFPCEFADARIARQQSALARWDKHVRKWKAWAKTCGRSVEFVRWDNHELLMRLSKPEHQGRFWFWFNAPAMDPDWFRHSARGATKQAHDRYSPKIHFDLPLAERFEALARGPAFRKMIGTAGATLASVLSGIDRAELATKLGARGTALRTSISDAISVVSALPVDLLVPLNCGAATQAMNGTLAAVYDAQEEFWIWQKTEMQAFREKFGRDPSPDEMEVVNRVRGRLRETEAALDKVTRWFRSEDVDLASRAAMMLTGDAGFGKTHLLCSIAEQRTAAGLPTILLLGERFDGSEPWSNALELLGLRCTRDEFLGALDAAGEAVGSRALILIDAINEGEGVTFWKKHLGAILAEVARYPHLGIAFSIRTAYEPALGPIARPCVRVAHRGFSGQVMAASRHFFRAFGLAEPNVPILNPEFENPLFLKLLCQAVKDSGQLEIPASLRGISTLFSFILEQANARLAEEMDYDPTDRLVFRAIDCLARLMAECGRDLLPLALVKDELAKLHPVQGHRKSLFQQLISEHLLVRVTRANQPKTYEEFVRFTYQRLSDHLVIRALLANTTKRDASRLFKKGGRLSEVGRSPDNLPGWIAALAIQLPETHGLEIDQVTLSGFEDDLVRQAFLASVIWRMPAAFTPATDKRISRLLSDPRSEEAFEVLDAVIAVTACVDHPYNGDWLDGWLKPHAMAARDAFWSVYVFGKLGLAEDASAVGRLIGWAWAERQESHFPDTVARLGALTLAWCLTTSDRFVRDRATKALVALLEQRVQVLDEVLTHFAGVDDPYLQERLHAVAYGCALLTQQKDELRILAQHVYDRIFRAGAPPASVLLRDHARGVVDTASRRGLQLDFEPTRIIPPFQSPPPKTPPSLEDLSTRYRAPKYDQSDAGLRRIFESVTADDFKHYVVGDVVWWHSRRLKARAASPRASFERLLASLPPDDAKSLELYAETLAQLHRAPTQWSPENGPTPSRLKYVAAMEAALPFWIGKSRVAGFKRDIVPFLRNPDAQKHEAHFDIELFQRLILQRVLQLGYTSERFSEFDSHIHGASRQPYKPERIGKKYQWIAYDELHARISDNFGLAEGRTKIMPEEDWSRGTWPSSFRDIDPSFLLRSKPSAEEGDPARWWTPHRYTAWPSDSRVDWLKSTTDLPPIEDFLRATDPTGNRHLLLNNYASWRREGAKDDGGQREGDTHEIHYIIRSYMVRRPHLAAVVGWGREQNWINDLLPSPDNERRRYLFEHYGSIHFDYPATEDWVEHTFGGDTDLPHPVLPTTADYLAEKGTYDCSVDDSVTIQIPTRALTRMAGLRVSGRNGDFLNAKGDLIAFDPSTREPGHGALAFREDAMRDLLRKENLALIWTLLGEKNIYPPDRANGWLGRQTLLGIYAWTGKAITSHFRTDFFAGSSEPSRRTCTSSGDEVGPALRPAVDETTHVDYVGSVLPSTHA